jgi:hypothetical protein
MSPLGKNCPYILVNGDFVFCSAYKERPKECANHKVPFRFCTVGLSNLKLGDIDAIRNRIDEGWRMRQEIKGERRI